MGRECEGAGSGPGDAGDLGDKARREEPRGPTVGSGGRDGDSGAVARRKVRVALGLFALLVVLGAADFVLTVWELRNKESVLGEGNRVAAWVLKTLGWDGLAVFKGLTIGVVGVACLLLWRWRAAWVPNVLGLGCLATAGVVVYTLGLVVGSRPPANGGGHSPEEIWARQKGLERERTEALNTANELEAVATDLRDRRTSLAQGVERLLQTTLGSDPVLLTGLRRQYAPLTGRKELVAASLVQNTLERMGSRAARKVRGDQLAVEFRMLYGKELPDPYARRQLAPPVTPAGFQKKTGPMGGPENRARVD